MAVIRNTASALRKGKVGNETYYVSLNKQIVRVAQNNSNYGESASRTPSQQGNRVKWANLVNFYKISSAWMRKAFENKQSNQTDYNRFMQLNLSQSRIYLTREAAQAGAIVADRFAVSQGSLRSINIKQLDGAWQTDIRIGNLTIGTATTVADLTAAILENNNWAELGMQLSFISYQQSTDPFGFPKAMCTAYELTLDTEDTRLVRDLLPEFCSTTKTGGFLGTNDDISIGAFAYILSQTKGGKTLVSTQTLVTNNAIMITQYSSVTSLLRSIDSYGVTADAFLDSGSTTQNATPQPLYITGIRVAGLTPLYAAGEAGPNRKDCSGKVVTILMSSPIPEAVDVLAVQSQDGIREVENLTLPTISEDRKSITATFPVLTPNYLINYMKVQLSSGFLDLQFDNSGSEHD